MRIKGRRGKEGKKERYGRKSVCVRRGVLPVPRDYIVHHNHHTLVIAVTIIAGVKSRINCIRDGTKSLPNAAQ